MIPTVAGTGRTTFLVASELEKLAAGNQFACFERPELYTRSMEAD